DLASRARGHSRGRSLSVDRSNPPLTDVLEFMRVLWALDHALHKGSKRMASKLGVTAPQRLVIRIVGRFPALPAGRLGALLHLHPSTLTGVLARLEAQGLLRRKRDPGDGRRWLLVLTAKGARMDIESAGTIESAVRSALRAAAPREQAAACKLLGMITRA